MYLNIQKNTKRVRNLVKNFSKNSSKQIKLQTKRQKDFKGCPVLYNINTKRKHL